MVNLKNWQKLFFLLAVGFSLCAVQACSSDDDTMDDPSGNREDIAVTGKVTQQGATYACINGYANLDLLFPDSKGEVNWGMIGANGIKIGIEVSSASGQSRGYTNSLDEREFAVECQDLVPETEYKYRAFVEYGGFYHYGEYATFTTKELPCMVTTGGAAGIEYCSARITSSIKSAAVDARENFTVGVAYSKSSSFTSKPEEAIIADSRRSIKEVSNGSYTVVLDDLNGETTYYYAAFSEAGGKYSFGETKSFKTKRMIVNGHEAVNLGLSVNWATCNVGASSPEEFGEYYEWSEYLGNKWGGNWRLPTKEEFEELINECSWKNTTQNGVNGKLATGPNGSSIFLPCAGHILKRRSTNEYTYGVYWSVTTIDDEKSKSYAQDPYWSLFIYDSTEPDVSFFSAILINHKTLQSVRLVTD